MADGMIPKKQALQIIKDEPTVCRPDLTPDWSLNQAYELVDGRVLLVTVDGKGRFYESAAQLKELNDSAPTGVTHELEGVFSFGPEFETVAAVLARQLVADLGGGDELDFTLESLPHLEDRLSKKGIQPRKLMVSEYARVLAYVGEVVGNYAVVTWEVTKVPGFDVCEPFLVVNGHRTAMFDAVHRQMDHDRWPISLRTVVILTVGGYLNVN